MSPSWPHAPLPDPRSRMRTPQPPATSPMQARLSRCSDSLLVANNITKLANPP